MINLNVSISCHYFYKSETRASILTLATSAPEWCDWMITKNYNKLRIYTNTGNTYVYIWLAWSRQPCFFTV
ncbi:hypothetical protein EB796_001253 [Bugula neritina]|uniref:Uncharacterized protein n=1 Tax=Bugula neritina TaxID=10212 RepID=A0A7J7KQK8_BUGNE|nr:hypothetical protein EB796_001253 [Bugula neritina]